MRFQRRVARRRRETVPFLRSPGAIGAVLTQERVTARLAAAGRRGRRRGRPVAIDGEKLAAVVAALDGGATRAAVRRTFGIKRSTLIDSLARIGWSAGLKMQGSISNAPTAIDRGPDCHAV